MYERRLTPPPPEVTTAHVVTHNFRRVRSAFRGAARSRQLITIAKRLTQRSGSGIMGSKRSVLTHVSSVKTKPISLGRGQDASLRLHKMYGVLLLADKMRTKHTK